MSDRLLWKKGEYFYRAGKVHEGLRLDMLAVLARAYLPIPTLFHNRQPKLELVDWPLSK